MNIIKKTIRWGVERSGIDTDKFFDIFPAAGDQMGIDPFADMQRFVKAEDKMVVFDVGGNLGQSVKRIRNAFPNASVHSFEPSPSTFKKLKANCEGMADVKTWNNGVGSTNGTLSFQENDHSDMSSFLQPSQNAWGKVVRSTEVPVIRVDSFAKEQKIDFIHILKSDTQGYDFEVLKGAEGLMKENKVGLVYFEFIFSEMYKNLPPFNEVFKYLMEQNFALVTFYRAHFQKDLIGWTDVMFVNREFYQKRPGRKQTEGAEAEALTKSAAEHAPTA